MNLEKGKLTVKFKYAVLGLAALALSACSTATTTVSNDVAAAEVSLTTAEHLALFYTRLPRCGGAVAICSNQATVDKIKALDSTAYTAVHAAMDNKGTLSAALTAVSAFSTAIPK